MTQLSSQHARQRLLFYISDDIEDERDVAEMQRLVEQMVGSRQWVISPPVFLNEDEVDDEAGVLRTVGGYFHMYSALPPWDEQLPANIDRAHLEEVKAIIGALTEFSRATGHEIAFELDGSQIGWIEQGVPDKSLREGLLDEWEKTLA